ncbi:MAG: CNNM domain-containing protein [Bdellovibrionota bacterium]
MFLLILTILISVSVSFTCSLIEAAFYSLPMTFVYEEAKKGSLSGKLLLKFKKDMGKPISAILILNTVANTTGASVSGWLVGELYGANALLPFSIFYTLLILYCSEIIPKLIGVANSRFATKLLAVPLNILIKILYPLIYISQFVSKKFQGNSKGEKIRAEEVLTIAEMGTKEGALDNLEGAVIENIIELDGVLVKTIMTPRTVVTRFMEDLTLDEIALELENLAFSRIPLYSSENPDKLTSYVTQRDILQELIKGNRNKKLKSIARPLKTVPDLMRCDALLLDMFNTKEHFYAAVDEYGGLSGIITLEDIIEQIIGHEIVDEYDAVSNLRALARLLRFKKCRENELSNNA